MLLYETFKHKFDVKQMENDLLLTRVEELSQMTGSLEDTIMAHKNRNMRLERDLEDLREKLRLLKSSSGMSSCLSSEIKSSEADQL